MNEILNMDCMEGLLQIEDNAVDLIVTSPPYNLDLGNNKYNKTPYSLYNDNKEHSEYINWLCEIFKICHRKLKHGGRVCINIGSGKNGNVPTQFDIMNFMINKIGFIPITQIIWNKNQVGNRTSWGSFSSPSSPSFPTPFEYILVFAKGDKKLQYKGDTDLTKEEFIDWSLALWTIAPENKQKKIGHPAMFPIELAKRCIKMFSYVDAFVVDPFGGAGTTNVACIETRRNCMSFEIDKNYCEIANKRIKEVLSCQN